MKKKISATVDEEVYNKLMKLWKEEQQKALRLKNPKAVKFSKIIEKILMKGLKG